jgi:hypothetical protein
MSSADTAMTAFYNHCDDEADDGHQEDEEDEADKRQ